MAKIVKQDKNFIYDKEFTNNLKRKFGKVKTGIKTAIYKIMMNVSVPKRKSEPKYNVSICGIFKNEGKYLREWIEFHKVVGIDHFYMYNNNSEDNFREVLKPYIEEGIVTLVEWPKNQAQMEAYQDCIFQFANETKWLGFIDIDEFVVPKSTNDVYSFLKNFDKKTSAVLIYWKMFGSSGKLNRDISGLVTEDLTVCWPKLMNVGKCFFNTKYTFDNSSRNVTLHHQLWAKSKRKAFPPVNMFGKFVFNGRHLTGGKEIPIQINHYFSKTYNEYLEKKSKGDVYFKINPHDEEYFYDHEMNNTSVDYSAYKYLVKLKNNLKNKK